MSVRIFKRHFAEFFPKVRKLYKLDNKDDLEVTFNLKGDTPGTNVPTLIKDCGRGMR